MRAFLVLKSLGPFCKCPYRLSMEDDGQVLFYPVGQGELAHIPKDEIETYINEGYLEEVFEEEEPEPRAFLLEEVPVGAVLRHRFSGNKTIVMRASLGDDDGGCPRIVTSVFPDVSVSDDVWVEYEWCWPHEQFSEGNWRPFHALDETDAEEDEDDDDDDVIVFCSACEGSGLSPDGKEMCDVCNGNPLSSDSTKWDECPACDPDSDGYEPVNDGACGTCNGTLRVHRIQRSQTKKKKAGRHTRECPDCKGIGYDDDDADLDEEVDDCETCNGTGTLLMKEND